MKIGDYVRTRNNKICKIIDKKFDDTLLIDLYEIDTNGYLMEIDIIKSSSNIIDLIEVGDYVNGCPVLHKENNELVCGLLLRYKEANIQNVVTKEQFESMEYKLGE